MEERILNISENKLLTRTFEDVRELENLYSSWNIGSLIKSKRNRLLTDVAHMGMIMNEYTYLVKNVCVEETLWKSVRKWKCNIKEGLTDVNGDSVSFVLVTQNKDTWQAVVNSIMNTKIPYQGGNSMSSRVTGSSSEGTREDSKKFFHSITFTSLAFLWLTSDVSEQLWNSRCWRNVAVCQRLVCAEVCALRFTPLRLLLTLHKQRVNTGSHASWFGIKVLMNMSATLVDPRYKSAQSDDLEDHKWDLKRVFQFQHMYKLDRRRNPFVDRSLIFRVFKK
jgi:hypothetical protein